MPSILASDFFASIDSSLRSGEVARRSWSAPASIAAEVAAEISRCVVASRVAATSCSRISRSASDIWWVRFSASARSARSAAEVSSASSSLTRSSVAISFSVWPASRSCVTRSSSSICGPPRVVGQLELSARLEVLQPAVDLLVVGGRVVQLPDQLVDPLLQRVALAGRRRCGLVGRLGALALAARARRATSSTAPSVRDRSACAAASDRRTSSASLCACVTAAERSLISRSSVLISARAACSSAWPSSTRCSRDAASLRAASASSRAASRSTRTVSSSAAARRAVDSACVIRSASPASACCSWVVVGRLHLGDLPLEGLARVAHLLLELGLALDQLGAERGVAALQLGLRRAKLVLEHRRALFLVAQRPQLGPRVVELAAGAIRHRLRRRSGRPSSAGARCGSCRAPSRSCSSPAPATRSSRRSASVSCARVRSSSRRRLSASSSRVARRPSSAVTGARRASCSCSPMRARSVRRVSSCGLEGAELSLRAQRALLELGIGGGPRLARQRAEVLELLERLAVLVLEQPETFLGGGRPLFGAPPRLALLAEAGLWRRGAGRLHRGCGTGELGGSLGGVGHDREQSRDAEHGQTQHHEHREQEQRVRVPRTWRGGDGRVRARQLHDRRAPHAGTEPERAA